MAWSSFYGMQMKPGDILTQSQWNEHIRRTLDSDGAAYATGVDFAHGDDATVVSVAEANTAYQLGSITADLSGLTDAMLKADKEIQLTTEQMAALLKTIYAGGHVMTAGSSPRCPKCGEFPTRYFDEAHYDEANARDRIERLERDLAAARASTAQLQLRRDLAVVGARLAMLDRMVAEQAEPRRRAMTLTGEVPA